MISYRQYSKMIGRKWIVFILLKPVIFRSVAYKVNFFTQYYVNKGYHAIKINISYMLQQIISLIILQLLYASRHRYLQRGSSVRHCVAYLLFAFAKSVSLIVSKYPDFHASHIFRPIGFFNVRYSQECLLGYKGFAPPSPRWNFVDYVFNKAYYLTSFLKHVSSLAAGEFGCYSVLITLPLIFLQNKIM